MILTRQNLPTLDRTKYAPASGVAHGRYVLADAAGGKPAVILLATGSEVSLCVAAFEQLTKAGIAARVVSMPSWQLFEQQTPRYRNQVLPPDVTARVGVEVGIEQGWERIWGRRDSSWACRTSASAPIDKLLTEFHFRRQRRGPGQVGTRRR